MPTKDDFFERVLSKYNDLTEDQLLSALYGITIMYASDKAKMLPQSERKGRSEEEFLIVLGEIIASSSVKQAIKITNEYEEHSKKTNK